MTWKTSAGNRVLGDYEQYVFTAMLNLLLDNYWMTYSSSVGCAKLGPKESGFEQVLGNCAFEKLTDKQKIALFWKVAYYLMEDTGDDIPTLTNLNESAIYYVYSHFSSVDLAVSLDFESESEKGDDLLEAVLKCVDLYLKDEEDEEEDPDLHQYHQYPTSRDDKDESRWKNAIEDIADRILWDRDFEEDFEDLPDPIMQRLMIGSDYSVTFREDPRFPSKFALDRCRDYLLHKEHELIAKLFGDTESPSNETQEVIPTSRSSSDRVDKKRGHESDEEKPETIVVSKKAKKTINPSKKK